jgi:hypothetical protein
MASPTISRCGERSWVENGSKAPEYALGWLPGKLLRPYGPEGWHAAHNVSAYRREPPPPLAAKCLVIEAKLDFAVLPLAEAQGTDEHDQRAARPHGSHYARWQSSEPDGPVHGVRPITLALG